MAAIASIALAAVSIAALAMVIAVISFFVFGDRQNGKRPMKVSNEGSFMTIDGVQIHYITKGTGTPLLLIHGFGAWSYSWRHNIGPLSRDFKVYALDLKGFGLSDKPAKANYSLEAQAKLVSSFMDELGIKKAVIAGSSLGGEIALKLYSMKPECVKGLILIDSTGYLEGPNGPRVASHPRWFRLALIRTLVLTKWQVRRQLYRAYHMPEKTVTEDIVEEYYRPLKAEGMDEAALAIWDTLRLENEIPIIRSIGVPTLIIWGENDRVIPLSFAHRFKADIPKAKLVIVKNAGHAPQEENPQRVNEAIRNFESSIEP